MVALNKNIQDSGTGNEAAIVARALNRSFGDLKAVDDLHLRVAPGEIYGLVGPDGAGKTTTLRMLASILDPSDGYIEVAGFDVSRDPGSVKDRMAYMSQRFALYFDLTVRENIDFYADLYGVPRKGRRQRMDELLGSALRRHETEVAAGLRPDSHAQGFTSG